MPKVSVVIPCYNQGDFIDETVDSVLAQSFDDYEIIIVNDGSTDEATNDKLAAYDRPKTRVLVTDNHGLAGARNNGIAEALGEYILPLDSDDKIEKTYLEKAVGILDNNKDIGIVYSRARLFGALDSEWILPEFSLDEMLIDNIIFCSAFFRRQDWETAGGYDTSMVYGWEDYDFWLSLLERGSIAYKIPEILFYYRITADSMVRSKTKEQKLEIFEKIYRKHPKLYNDNIRIWIDKLIDTREIYQVARLYLDTGDGFNEQQRLTQKIDERTFSLTFDISRFHGAKQLRFNPINDYCVLHLTSAELTYENGNRAQLAKYHGNILEPQSSNLVFSDKDPFLLFDLKDYSFQGCQPTSFVITFQFIEVGETVFHYLLKRKDDALHQQRETQYQQQQEIELLKKQLSQCTNSMTSISSLKETAKGHVRNARLLVKKAKYHFKDEYRVIKESGLFNPVYYLAENPDLRGASIDPLIHYLENGWAEGRNPNALFATVWYLEAYQEVLKAEINPLYHYISSGWREGKNPSPMFETTYYLKNNPDVDASGQNPLKHFLDIGGKEGRKPNPLFDCKYYLEIHDDVRESGENPLVHYCRLGYFEGRPTHKKKEQFKDNPLISVITPVYNVPEIYLRACIDSVLEQLYDNWELCLADDASPKEHVKKVLQEYADRDPRIKVSFLAQNQGIAGATNAAVELASGDYLAFLDNDDELSRNALLETVRVINEQAAEIIYSDECFIDQDGKFQDAHHKPDFSGDLLFNHNYITHFTVMKKELFTRAGGVSSQCDGAQDYDLMLRVTELTDRIIHIPKILYRWRTLETSTAADPGAKTYAIDAGKKALEMALERRSIKGTVSNSNLPFYYRVRRDLVETPLVSIIIPFCDQADYLRKCIASILDRSTYENYEIIGVNNNSSQEETLALIQGLSAKDERITFLDFPGPFNYSKINNFAVGHAKGEHIVLMNNDIEVLNEDWIETLLEHSQRPEVGAVGAKLYYGNETIQHAGVIVGIKGFAGHSHRHSERNDCGYFNRLNCIQNISAVTAALLMVKKSAFEEVDGLDEDNLTVALNDVDFCLKLGQKGYANIFTPYCEAYHYESVSRGYEDTPDKKARFEKEADFFKNKWADFLAAGDPYYNPNLTLERETFWRNKFQKWYDSEEQRLRILNESLS
ncbi:MAG: glycosyltransferase [Desulfobulbaceae bacterium]|nr:glycosyltransferase [Desulfobulbaceae bacterium]